MELLQLRYFLAVAESEHMTNTAKQLHIAQPALTQSIHRLEQELGVSLFERAGRGIRLSPAGAYVRDRVKPAMETLENVARAVQLFHSVDAGPVFRKGDISAHKAQRLQYLKPVFKDIFLYHADSRSRRHRRQKLGLKIGGKSGIRFRFNFSGCGQSGRCADPDSIRLNIDFYAASSDALKKGFHARRRRVFHKDFSSRDCRRQNQRPSFNPV